LVLANHLAPKFSVLVVEKEKLGQTKAIWISDKLNLEGSDLTDCVRFKPKFVSVKTYLGPEISIPVPEKNYAAVLDERKVLTKLIQKAKKARVDLIDHCPFFAFSYSQKGIEITTFRGEFEGQLLIDASGGGSRIGEAFKLVEKKFYWSFYGGEIKGLSSFNYQKAFIGEFLAISSPRIVWVVYPTSPTSGYFFAMIFDSEIQPDHEMKTHFETCCNTPKYYSLLKRKRLLAPRYGSYPLKALTKNALDRVLLVGDAGGMTPLATGAGFNIILSHYPELAAKIATQLRKSDLSQKDLLKNIRLPLKTRYNLAIQKIMINLTVKASDLQFAKMWTLINELEIAKRPGFFRGLAKSQAEPEELVRIFKLLPRVFSLKEIASFLSPSELLEEIKLGGKLIEKLAVDEIRQLLHLNTS
jgi:flavin-dependent dehydrogenase